MKRTNKGFTLAELLVVVAIIAVLVAVAIPVFSSQLEKSREATDLANIRSEYAAFMTNVLTEEYDPSAEYRVDLKQMIAGWQSFQPDTNPLNGLFHEVIGQPDKNGYATMRYDAAAGKQILQFNGGGSSAPIATFPDRSTTMRDTLKEYFTGASSNKTGITCWDSTYYSQPNGLKDVVQALQNAGANEIKAWTIININATNSNNKFPYNNPTVMDKNRDPAYFDEAEKDLYYLWTGVDITPAAMVGQKVPVMVSYTNDSGVKVYSVADVEVKNGNSSNYHVISGNPRPHQSSFNINNLLENNTQFEGDYNQAYAEYERRLHDFTGTE